MTTPKEVRLAELFADLTDVRAKIREARKGPSVSLDGHSLTRQSLDALRQEESTIMDDILYIKRGGPFGKLIITGENDHNIVVRSDQL